MTRPCPRVDHMLPPRRPRRRSRRLAISTALIAALALLVLALPSALAVLPTEPGTPETEGGSSLPPLPIADRGTDVDLPDGEDPGGGYQAPNVEENAPVASPAAPPAATPAPTQAVAPDEQPTNGSSSGGPWGGGGGSGWDGGATISATASPTATPTATAPAAPTEQPAAPAQQPAAAENAAENDDEHDEADEPDALVVNAAPNPTPTPGAPAANQATQAQNAQAENATTPGLGGSVTPGPVSSSPRPTPSPAPQQPPGDTQPSQTSPGTGHQPTDSETDVLPDSLVDVLNETQTLAGEGTHADQETHGTETESEAGGDGVPLTATPGPATAAAAGGKVQTQHLPAAGAEPVIPKPGETAGEHAEHDLENDPAYAWLNEDCAGLEVCSWGGVGWITFGAKVGRAEIEHGLVWDHNCPTDQVTQYFDDQEGPTDQLCTDPEVHQLTEAIPEGKACGVGLAYDPAHLEDTEGLWVCSLPGHIKVKDVKFDPDVGPCSFVAFYHEYQATGGCMEVGLDVGHRGSVHFHVNLGVGVYGESPGPLSLLPAGELPEDPPVPLSGPAVNRGIIGRGPPQPTPGPANAPQTDQQPAEEVEPRRPQPSPDSTVAGPSPSTPVQVPTAQPTATPLPADSSGTGSAGQRQAMAALIVPVQSPAPSPKPARTTSRPPVRPADAGDRVADALADAEAALEEEGATAATPSSRTPKPGKPPTAASASSRTKPPATANLVDPVTHEVIGTCRDGACGLNKRKAPSLDAGIVGAVLEGEILEIECQTRGDAVSNGQASSAVWHKLEDGTWVAGFYTNPEDPGRTVPECS